MATYTSILAWRISWTKVTVRVVAKGRTRLSNCGVGEDARESLRQQGDPTTHS